LQGILETLLDNPGDYHGPVIDYAERKEAKIEKSSENPRVVGTVRVSETPLLTILGL
jgi:hypothetical protein